MQVCTSCEYPTNDYTYMRQRIVCRRCWELMGYSQSMIVDPTEDATLEEEE